MAEAVVDILEPVEIDEQNADIVIAEMLRFWKGLGQPVHKERPVRQARQGIVRRLVLQLLISVLFMGNVLDLKDKVWCGSLRRARRRNAERCPDGKTRPVTKPLLHLAVRYFSRQQLIYLYQAAAEVLGLCDRLKIARQQLRLGITENVGQCPVYL